VVNVSGAGDAAAAGIATAMLYCYDIAMKAAMAVILASYCAASTKTVADGCPVMAPESTIMSHGMPFPRIVVAGENGATTVAGTMILAAMAGIRFFATGGIGGVPGGSERTMNVSADLDELARTDVAVVYAGEKSILDIPKTLEFLETKGVVVANPIPADMEMDIDVINNAIDLALEESMAQGIRGKHIAPFLLARAKDLTGGDSLESNIALVINNARLAAAIAVAYADIGTIDVASDGSGTGNRMGKV